MADFQRRTPPGVEPRQKAPQKKVEPDRLSWNKFSAEPTRYDRMEFRRCGNSGLKVPAISLGTWQTFGTHRGPETTRECIFGAFNLGITHFDVSNSYGSTPGRAETFLGRVFREMPREEIVVATKAGAAAWPGPAGRGASRKHLFSAIDQSLQRLGLDHVDIFYAQSPDPDTPWAETLSALNDIVGQGKARYIGLCGYPREILEQLCHEARSSGAPLIVHQAPYNLLQRENEQSFVELSRSSGIGFVACSPLMQGILSAKYLGDFPEESRAAKVWSPEQRAVITPGLKERIRHLMELAKTRGQTLPQMAIAWVLRRPEITTALMGASDAEQIEQNVKALDNLNFSEDELRRIDEISAE